VFFLDWWRPQDRAQLGYRYVLQLAIVFALYFGAGKLGLTVPFTTSNVSPIWPAAGVAVAAVLIWGIQIAPAIAVAAFLVNFLSPVPTYASIAIGFGNASSAVVAGFLLRRSDDFEVSLPRLKDVLKLVTFAAVLATAIAASVGVTALTLTHTKALAGYGFSLANLVVGRCNGGAGCRSVASHWSVFAPHLSGLACTRSLFAFNRHTWHFCGDFQSVDNSAG